MTKDNPTSAELGVLFESSIESLELVHRGKVRDVYAVDDERLLMVTCDRLSAFDVVMPTPVPGKGAVLNQLSRFWFALTSKIIPNHLLNARLAEVIGDHPQLSELSSRAAIVQRLRAIPIEAVVRGYLIGSGWKDYQREGAVCGIELPAGLKLAQQLAQPIFTPAAKAAVGEHDENISFAQACDTIGVELAEKIRQVSLKLYAFASDYAKQKGIVVADCKFEFGLDADGALVLMDELFTPDSSRFWPADCVVAGASPPSYDKQYVRDYLETLDWPKVAPGPLLPPKVVEKTRAKYFEAYQLLTGQPLIGDEDAER